MSKLAQSQPEMPAATSGFHRRVRWWAMSGLLLAALFVAGRYIVLDEIDGQLRVQVEGLLQERFADCQVQVQSARRMGNKGILVQGITVWKTPTEASSCQLLLEELEVHCDADLASLLQKQLEIRRLVVRRPTLEACRLADGSWCFPRPRANKPLPKIPVIEIDDGTLRCWDVTRQDESLLVFSRLEGTVLPVSLASTGALDSGPGSGLQECFQFEGQCSSEHFKRLQLKGAVTRATGSWQAQGTIESMQMDSSKLFAGPWELSVPWPSELEVKCHSEIAWAVRYTPPADGVAPATSDWDIAVRARVREGYVRDQRLPYPVTDIEANVAVENGKIEVSDFAGRFGTAVLAGTFHSQDLQLKTPWRLRAELKQLALNDALANKLPVKWRQTYDRFSPRGHVDIDLTLQPGESRVHTNLKVQCQDTSFVYDRFPYPLEGGHGLVQWADGVLVIDGFRATAHGQLVRMDGRIEDPETFSRGWVEISSAGPIPLDAPLLDALKEQPRRSIAALHPTGMVTLHRARFERDDRDGGVLHHQIDLELNDCSIKPDKFPYPINRIQGRVTGHDGKWDFQEVVGRSGGAYVQCTGSWQQYRDRPALLLLNVTATDVPLDTTLREAITRMNPRTGQEWESLQPQGTLDRLTVQLRHPGPQGKTQVAIQGQKLPREVDATGPGLMVKPRWFPYRVDHLTGIFSYHDGQVSLTGMKGRHGKSVIRLDGNCSFPVGGPWDVKLSNLTVDHLLVDHELLAALPVSLRQSVEQLDISGPLMLRGQLQLAAADDPGRKLDAQWDVNLETAGATLDSGLKLEHIYGGVRLFGLYDQGGLRCRGQFDVDSLYFRKEQLTHLRGPLWIDSRQVLIGSWADQQVRSGKVEKVTAKSLGGHVVIDAQLVTGKQSRFFLQVALHQGDLPYILNQRGVAAKVSGKADATLQLSGTPAGVHTWNGRGTIRLRNADIYRVPLMVALLSLVSVRPPDTTAFTSSDISYRIQSDRIYLDRIQFNGDAISLEGNGWLDLDNQINLSFYTLVGRNELRIPVISSVLAEASRNLLKIQVVGTLDQPKINGSAFPELDETMQNILEELSRPRADLIERLPRTGGGD